jgi:hypothetical protein
MPSPPVKRAQKDLETVNTAVLPHWKGGAQYSALLRSTDATLMPNP